MSCFAHQLTGYAGQPMKLFYRNAFVPFMLHNNKAILKVACDKQNILIKGPIGIKVFKTSCTQGESDIRGDYITTEL